jgi:hydroxyethylthiazole kinase-like uncharacterized protein yjeF
MTGSWTPEDAARVLRRPTTADDKYSRGVLGIRTGSTAYPGAAVLGVEAAWRTGVGMVRYLGPERPTHLVLARRPETVTVAGRVQAWLIGSGTDADERSDAETAALRSVLSGPHPVVVDAGALGLAVGAPAPRIVTPHAREHARLRTALGLDDVDPASTEGRIAAARETAAALRATVVLKGAATVVARPDGWSVLVETGTPWLATAGTGDVLGGVIGALVAAAAAGRPGADDMDLGALAATGAWLHGRAATLAAARIGPRGGPITALDVAEALPFAVAEALPPA